MKTLLSVLTAVFVLAANSASAQQSGVEVSFMEDGGMIYKVNPEAFTINYAVGSFQAEGYVVPRHHRLRNGCLLSTPWIQVGHADGEAILFPHLTVEWWGELHPISQPDLTLLRLQIDIRKADGTLRRMRSYVHTGLLELRPRAYLDEGWVAYSGRLDNPLASQGLMNFGHVSVSELDEIRYSICDAASGVKLTVRKLVLQTYPVQ